MSAAGVASSTEKVPVLGSAAPTATLTPPAQAVPAQRSTTGREATLIPPTKTTAAQRSRVRTGTHTPRRRKLFRRKGRRRARGDTHPRRCRRERDRVVLESDREMVWCPLPSSPAPSHLSVTLATASLDPRVGEGAVGQSAWSRKTPSLSAVGTSGSNPLSSAGESSHPSRSRGSHPSRLTDEPQRLAAG